MPGAKIWFNELKSFVLKQFSPLDEEISDLPCILSELIVRKICPDIFRAFETSLVHNIKTQEISIMFSMRYCGEKVQGSCYTRKQYNKIMFDLLNEINDLYSIGIIHMDIRKPNVLYNSGELTLIDFEHVSFVVQPKENIDKQTFVQMLDDVGEQITNTTFDDLDDISCQLGLIIYMFSISLSERYTKDVGLRQGLTFEEILDIFSIEPELLMPWWKQLKKKDTAPLLNFLETINYPTDRIEDMEKFYNLINQKEGISENVYYFLITVLVLSTPYAFTKVRVSFSDLAEQFGLLINAKLIRDMISLLV